MIEKDKLSIATGNYSVTIKKICIKLHNSLCDIIKKIEITEEQKQTIFFDTLYSLLLSNAIRAEQSKEAVHKLVDWYYDNNNSEIFREPIKEEVN